MSFKSIAAGAALSAMLALSAPAFAQNPFAAAPMENADDAIVAAPPAAPVADNPFAAAPEPAAPADPAAPAEPAAPASPFGAPGETDAAAAPASPFGAPGETDAAAAPASPFGAPGDASAVNAISDSPFGSVGDTSTDGTGGVANVFDPITYWYSLEYPEGTDAAPQATGTTGFDAGGQTDPNAEPAGPTIDDATAKREEITYSEYKRRYNERVQAIQAVYQTTNEQDWQNRGWDPRAMAEWKVYYEQMEAWKKYVEDTVLDAKVSGGVDEIDFAGLDQAGVDEAAQSIADQLREVADKETEKLEGLIVAMVERLDQRKNRRINYFDWRAEQEAVFLEFAERWIKQSQGEEINIDGNMYLISDRPIQNAPRDVLPVMTTNLTPYDIFNDDGTLKRPQ